MKKIRKYLIMLIFTGDILLEAVRQVEPGVAIGKILIQGCNSIDIA